MSCIASAFICSRAMRQQSQMVQLRSRLRKQMPAAVMVPATLSMNPIVRNSLAAVLSAFALALSGAPVYLSSKFSHHLGLCVNIGLVTPGKKHINLHNLRISTTSSQPLLRAPFATLSENSVRLRKPLITHQFADAGLRSSNWLSLISVRTSVPALHLPMGAVLRILAPPSENLGSERRVVPDKNFGANKRLGGSPPESVSAAALLVHGLTIVALGEAGMESVREDVRRAAKRLKREGIKRVIEDAIERGRERVETLRTVARQVDTLLEGLPDLGVYQEYARKSEHVLRQISEWLGGGNRSPSPPPLPQEVQSWQQQQQRNLGPSQREFRELDEQFARPRSQ